MVHFALLNGAVIRAAEVDRRTQSTLKAYTRYECVGCRHPMRHKSGSKITSHFAHIDSDCAYCPYYYYGSLMEPTTFKESEIDYAFVKKWQNGRPYYCDTVEGRLYNHGSSKGYIAIFNDVRDEDSKRIKASPNPPRVVLLNGECLKPEIYCTDDTDQNWVRFKNKSFIDDILRKKGVVLIDTNSPKLLCLNLLDKLDSENYDGELPKLLDQCFPCELIDIATAIRTYFPDDYTLTTEYNEVVLNKKILTNNVGRKAREVVAHAAMALKIRLDAEEQERKKEEQMREQKRLDEEQTELKKIIYQGRIRLLNSEVSTVEEKYVPRELKSRQDVVSLYNRYLSEYKDSSETTVINFAWQTANDGTPFIDISSKILGQDLKCSWLLSLLRTVTQRFLSS